MAPFSRSARLLAPLLAALIALAAVLALRRLRPDLLDAASVSELVQWAGPWGVALYVGAFVLATLALVPTSPLAVAGGFLFGPAVGVFAAWGGAMAGSWFAYGIGRTGHGRLRRALSARTRRFEGALDAHGFRAVIASRLFFLPLGPISYAWGLAGVPMRTYLVGSALGMFPLVLAFAIAGSAVGDAARLREPIFLIALGASVLAVAALAWRQPTLDHTEATT